MEKISSNFNVVGSYNVVMQGKNTHKGVKGKSTVENVPKDKVEIGSSIYLEGKKEVEAPKADAKAQKKLPSPPTPEKELTILFYMHGQYDDIGPAVAETMLNLEKAGPDKNVYVVTQLGRNPYKPDDPKEFHIPIDGDWSGVRRYEVKKDLHTDLDIPISKWLSLEKEMPKNPILQYIIGDYYWSKGDKETAWKYFNKAKKYGIVEYMNNYDSEKSKKIREEFNEKTRPLDEAMADKKVFASKVLQIMDPDVKMKDPVSLEDFVSWGMRKYPARHYMLVIMGHGGAWMGAAQMSPSKMGKAIEEGVKDAQREIGKDKKLDVLVFNSCYMGNVEAAVQMKDAADYSLISENYATTGIFDEWNTIIDGIKKNLKEGKPFDGKQFSKDMVEYFRKKGKEVRDNFPEFAPWKRSYLTLSAVDNKKLDGLVKAWKNFTKTCEKEGIRDDILFKAVKKAKNYPSGAYTPRQIFGFYDQIRDIGSIMDNLMEMKEVPKEVKDAASNVKKALKEVVIDEQHEGIGMDGSQGLTVWGPTNAVDVIFMGEYYKQDVPDFAKGTGWAERLKEAVNNIPKPIINGFLQVIKDIRALNKKLQEASSSEEKEKIQKEIDKKKDEALEFKKKMDFTIKRSDLFKDIDTPFELDMEQYGQIIEEMRQEAIKQGRFAKNQKVE